MYLEIHCRPAKGGSGMGNKAGRSDSWPLSSSIVPATTTDMAAREDKVDAAD